MWENPVCHEPVNVRAYQSRRTSDGRKAVLSNQTGSVGLLHQGTNRLTTSSSLLSYSKDDLCCATAFVIKIGPTCNARDATRNRWPSGLGYYLAAGNRVSDSGLRCG